MFDCASVASEGASSMGAAARMEAVFGVEDALGKGGASGTGGTFVSRAVVAVVVGDGTAIGAGVSLTDAVGQELDATYRCPEEVSNSSPSDCRVSYQTC